MKNNEYQIFDNLRIPSETWNKIINHHELTLKIRLIFPYKIWFNNPVFTLHPDVNYIKNESNPKRINIEYPSSIMMSENEYYLPTIQIDKIDHTIQKMEFTKNSKHGFNPLNIFIPYRDYMSDLELDDYVTLVDCRLVSYLRDDKTIYDVRSDK